MQNTYEILRYPDPRLRRKCLPVTNFGDEIRQIGRVMLATMYNAQGIGLAAAQVGVLKRIIVVDVSQEPGDALILVNPKITSSEGENSVEEGCLSVPNIFAKVKRAQQITVHYSTPEGKPKTIDCSDLLAICIQHEIDHLDGRLFVDYLPPWKRLQAWVVAKKRTAA